MCCQGRDWWFGRIKYQITLDFIHRLDFQNQEDILGIGYDWSFVKRGSCEEGQGVFPESP